MQKLSIAVPNGHLEKQVLAMLALVGILVAKAGRQFHYLVDHPLIGEVIFMRPQHMTWLVAEGKYDLAICGLDLYEEYNHNGARARDENRDRWCVKLGDFTGPKVEKSATRIVIFAGRKDPANSAADIPSGAAVISEYPGLTCNWLRGAKLRPDKVIYPSTGSTETHVPRDFRFGVCLTETGDSIESNTLKVIGKLLDTHPVLLSPSPEFRDMPEWKARAIGSMVRVFMEKGLLPAKENRFEISRWDHIHHCHPGCPEHYGTDGTYSFH